MKNSWARCLTGLDKSKEKHLMIIWLRNFSLLLPKRLSGGIGIQRRIFTTQTLFIMTLKMRSWLQPIWFAGSSIQGLTLGTQNTIKNFWTPIGMPTENTWRKRTSQSRNKEVGESISFTHSTRWTIKKFLKGTLPVQVKKKRFEWCLLTWRKII